MPAAHVVDLYRGDVVADWTAVRAAGVLGVIHKATQGVGYVDRTYALRRDDARSAGLLWGAYHFGTADPVAQQVDNFLEVIGRDRDLLLCLDWEPNGRKATMSVEQARQFVETIAAKTGQWPVLYCGSLAKETLPASGDPVLSKCRLWLSQYGAKPVCPPGWAQPWLWQFTGDGVGPGPHEIAGITTRGIDISQATDPERLAAEWTGRGWTPAAASVDNTGRAGPASDMAPAEPTLPTPLATPPATPSVPASEKVTAGEALRSPTIWGLTLAAVAKALETVGNWIDVVFGRLPDVVNDTQALLSPVQSLGAMVGGFLQNPRVLTALTFVGIFFAVYRRFKPRGA